MNTPKNRSRQELEAFYAERDFAVSELVIQGRINASDLAKLERLGRFKIADEHWAICDASARKALLNDAHHFVRSCAAIADQQQLKALA